jgi:CMP/dCMP kinase
MRPLIIAVDGPAGAGKTTVAKGLAKKLSLRHVDTGAMYRALGLKALDAGVDPSDGRALGALLTATSIQLEDTRVLLDGQDVTGKIRKPEVALASSQVATHPEVRRWMVARQREVVTAAEGGAVMEGRDIGTVVLPDADLKIYLTASEAVRARRRSDQAGIDLVTAAAELAGRDLRDTTRTASPLTAAEGSVTVDTTGLTVEEVIARLVALVEQVEQQPG